MPGAVIVGRLFGTFAAFQMAMWLYSGWVPRYRRPSTIRWKNVYLRRHDPHDAPDGLDAFLQVRLLVILGWAWPTVGFIWLMGIVILGLSWAVLIVRSGPLRETGGPLPCAWFPCLHGWPVLLLDICVIAFGGCVGTIMGVAVFADMVAGVV